MSSTLFRTSLRARRSASLAFASATLGFVGVLGGVGVLGFVGACGGEREAAVPRTPTEAPSWTVSDGGDASAGHRRSPGDVDGGTGGATSGDAGTSLDRGDGGAGSARNRRSTPLPRVIRDVAFGAGAVSPSDPHAFRLAADLRALRASPSGSLLTDTIALLPDVVAVKDRTGVDVVADGDWYLVYGEDIDVPGANANVLHHGRASGEVERAMTDSGLESFDVGGARAVRSELFAVRDALVLPRASLLAMVPRDRATDLAAALTKAFDAGLRSGELVRATIEEPSRATGLLPREVTHAVVTVRAGAGGGLDVGAEADCPSVDACKAIAEGLRERARRAGTVVVRIATRGLFVPLGEEGKPGGEGLRAEGTKLRAVLHASVDQVAGIVNFARAALGLPGIDPNRTKP